MADRHRPFVVVSATRLISTACDARGHRFEKARASQVSGMSESQSVTGVVFEILDAVEDGRHNESHKIIAVVVIRSRHHVCGAFQFMWLGKVGLSFRRSSAKNAT